MRCLVAVAFLSDSSIRLLPQSPSVTAPSRGGLKNELLLGEDLYMESQNIGSEFDLLLNLPGLKPVSIGINKTGRQSRDFPRMVEAGFQSDCHMLMFPAGLNSRKQEDGTIRDLPWKKTFISKSVEYQRDVVPIHFGGRNSERFYRIARFSDKHLPFNLAMLFLVDEMYKNVGKHFRIAIGKPIPWQTFDHSKSVTEWAQYVKDSVYKL